MDKKEWFIVICVMIMMAALSFVVGCIEVPNKCEDVLNKEQCNNLSDFAVPTCEDIFENITCETINALDENFCLVDTADEAPLFSCKIDGIIVIWQCVPGADPRTIICVGGES